MKSTILGANWVHLGSIHHHGIGEILLSIPKNTSYHGNQHQEVTSSGVESTKNKSEVVAEMGYSKDQASDYQRMAQNQAVVNLVLEQADSSQKSDKAKWVEILPLPSRKTYRLGDKDRRSAEICGAHDHSLLALKLKPVIAEKAKERMLSGKADPSQKSGQGKTDKELAKVAGVRVKKHSQSQTIALLTVRLVSDKNEPEGKIADNKPFCLQIPLN